MNSLWFCVWDQELTLGERSVHSPCGPWRRDPSQGRDGGKDRACGRFPPFCLLKPPDSLLSASSSQHSPCPIPSCPGKAVLSVVPSAGLLQGLPAAERDPHTSPAQPHCSTVKGPVADGPHAACTGNLSVSEKRPGQGKRHPLKSWHMIPVDQHFRPPKRGITHPIGICVGACTSVVWGFRIGDACYAAAAAAD